MGSVSARAPHHACTHAHEDGGGGRRRSAFRCGHRASTPRACEGSARRQRGRGRCEGPRHGAAATGSARTCLVMMPCVMSAVVRCVFSWPSSRWGGDPRISAGSATASLALLAVAGSRVSSGKVLTLAPTCLSMGGETALATSMVVACKGERHSSTHAPTHSEWRRAKLQRAADV